MLSTMIGLQNATQEAVHDEIVMAHASKLYHQRNEMDSEEFAKALYQYSAMLASMTTTLVTHVLLTETQLDEMIGLIKEFDELGKEMTNGND